MHIAVHHEKERRSVRIILYNGWLRDWTYPRLWMKSLAIHLSHTQYCVLGEGGHGLVDIDVEIVGNTVPVQTADSGRYIKHLSDMVGPAGPDENTFFIGQSIGCLVILRYLACLPPGFKIGGCLFVGCWLSLDHTTQRRRSPAIDDLIRTEWDTFKEGWMNHNDVDFAAVRRVCKPGKLLCLIADNDPYRGLDDNGVRNKRDFEETVGAEVILRHGKGHFNTSKLDEEDTRLIEEKLLNFMRSEAGDVRIPHPRTSRL